MRLMMLAAMLCGWVVPAAAQHEHQHSPYAGTQSETIPSLTPQEIEQLQNGEGMGFAKAAELNGLPGPKHVLELADQLALSEGQHRLVTEIRENMLQAAVEKGHAFLHAEHELNDHFESGAPTAEEVRRLTETAERVRGELRAIHLIAHIETADVLTREQVRRYNELRGY
jgi:hypothetical protein